MRLDIYRWIDLQGWTCESHWGQRTKGKKENVFLRQYRI